MKYNIKGVWMHMWSKTDATNDIFHVYRLINFTLCQKKVRMIGEKLQFYYTEILSKQS